jgi:PhzF family phenazine biosynthesis protein
MKKIIDLHQVDAFTDTLFGGNSAGVVTNADELNDSEMANIAKEMNLSETAFVLKPTNVDADIKLRYFTPTEEVQFCGHATVGALYELARLHMYGLGGFGQSSIRVETNIGVINISVTQGNDSQSRITFSTPKVSMEPYRLQGEEFAHSFGIPTDVLGKNGEILIDNELNYVYIPVRSLRQLGDLKFNYA